MKKLSMSTVTFVRLSMKLADRFERIGLDEDGNMDPDDKRLLKSVRNQANKVLNEPLKGVRG